MKRKVKLPFDPKVFLSKINGERAIHDYRKDKIVFRQGDPAAPFFTFRRARSSSPSFPSGAKKQS